jgi:hypothetical protein
VPESDKESLGKDTLEWKAWKPKRCSPDTWKQSKSPTASYRH